MTLTNMTIYILIILLALICGIVVAALAWPGAHRLSLSARRALIIILPLGSLGIYLLIGTPGAPGAPALYENEGPHYQWRQLVAQESKIMRQMAEYDNAPPADMFLELTRSHLAQGEIKAAKNALRYGRSLYPDHPVFNEALKRIKALETDKKDESQ